MHDAASRLLVSRILVREDLPNRAMRVELTYPGASGDLCGASRRHGPVARYVSPEDLVDLARSLAVDGLIFHADGSMIGRSGLRQSLPYLRTCLDGWIGLVTRGPEPADLQAVTAAGLLDFVDVELCWQERDGESGQVSLRTGPSLERLEPILIRATCPCMVRFTCPARGELFTQVSAVFDAFVRSSSEPVAARAFDIEPADSRTLPRLEGEECMEFVACRPASMLRRILADWLVFQGNPAGDAQGVIRRPRPCWRVVF